MQTGLILSTRILMRSVYVKHALKLVNQYPGNHLTGSFKTLSITELLANFPNCSASVRTYGSERIIDSKEEAEMIDAEFGG